MSFVSIKGNCPTLSQLPIGSLKAFGVNDYGEAIFRVIWSESRYYLVGAKHTEYDGDPSTDAVLKKRGKDPNVARVESCYKWLPLYPSVKAWILELWKSPLGFTGCTPDQWNERYLDVESGLLTLGPYPNRGEYSQCFTFPSGATPTKTLVHTVINRIKAGWDYSYAEHLAAQKKDNEDKKKASDNRMDAIFLDSQQAFKNRPSNVRPGKRTRDKIPLRKRAEDLQLHKRGFSTKVG